MKIALLAFFFFFFLLTFTKAEYVYDTQGEILSEAHSYHISICCGLGRPYFTLPIEAKCPVRLMAASISPDNPPPLPVKILPHNINTYITTDMPLNFTFVVDTQQCTGTSKWFVALRVPQGQWDLFFGDGHVRGEFYIKKHVDKGYMIIFCPYGEAESACGSVSYGDDGEHLAVDYRNNDPLEIYFEKVESGISMVV